MSIYLLEIRFIFLLIVETNALSSFEKNLCCCISSHFFSAFCSFLYNRELRTKDVVTLTFIYLSLILL